MKRNKKKVKWIALKFLFMKYIIAKSQADTKNFDTKEAFIKLAELITNSTRATC